MAATGANLFASWIFFFLYLLLFCFHLPTSCARPMVPALYILGDSLLDVGNNNYLPSSPRADFPPNGVDFPSKKPTGRFCNGKNAADFLAEKVGLPASPPYLQLLRTRNASFMTGVSFASAGAGIFNGSSKGVGRAIHLTEQVANYVSVYRTLAKSMERTHLKKHLSKSLFDIVIGSNDLFAYLRQPELRNRYTPQQYTNLMVISLNQQLKNLYMHGARKFIVTGIGMIGCPPALRLLNQTRCFANANLWALKYNAGLKDMLQQMKMELRGFSYSYSSAFSVMKKILHNPSNYGFSELKAACCGHGELRAKAPCLPSSTYCSNRSNYIFWDLYHPTEATDRIMTDYSFEGSSKYTQPMNVRQLIAV